MQIQMARGFIQQQQVPLKEWFRVTSIWNPDCSILVANDELILDRELSRSGKDVRMLNGIWKKLRDRIINRK
jgi:hypothetical protein